MIKKTKELGELAGPQDEQQSHETKSRNLKEMFKFKLLERCRVSLAVEMVRSKMFRGSLALPLGEIVDFPFFF